MTGLTGLKPQCDVTMRVIKKHDVKLIGSKCVFFQTLSNMSPLRVFITHNGFKYDSWSAHCKSRSGLVNKVICSAWNVIASKYYLVRSPWTFEYIG